MASKLIEFTEAAKTLGVTTEQLQEMRKNGEIHGYRDGTSWKFKSEELQRVIAERESGSAGMMDDTFDHLVPPGSPDDDSSSDMDSASILVSEEELGHSPHSPKSTIIGKNRDRAPKSGDDSDLKLASDSSLKSSKKSPSAKNISKDADSDSDDLTLAFDSGSSISPAEKAPGSDLSLGLDPKSSSPSSDMDFDFGTPKSSGAESGNSGDMDFNFDSASKISDIEMGASDELSFADEPKSKSSKAAPKGATKPAPKPADSDSELGLSLDDDDDIKLADERPSGKKTAASSTGKLPKSKLPSHSSDDDILSMDDDVLSLDEDGDLNLAGDGDDDLVLGGSKIGSDVSLDAQGSGINLGSPTDSGILLEGEPMELAGSQVESLELPEDDDVFSLDNDAEGDEATQLKADEEFLLSPLDDSGMEESSDSGSQVIALEDSDAFDENAVTMLKQGEAPLLAEDTGDVMGAPLAALGAGGMTAAMNSGPKFVPVPMQETPYSVWNVMGLLSVTLVMALSLMLMTDLLRNMWSWDGTASTTTSLMDGILGMLNIPTK